MSQDDAFDAKAIYEITVLGKLDPTWSDWFDGFKIICLQDTTRLVGPVPDQAALLGLLARIGQLNLRILKVEQRED